MSQAPDTPISIPELARRAAIRFLWDDCKTHPRLEEQKATAQKRGMAVDDNYKGAPPEAIITIICELIGRDRKAIQDELIEPMTGYIERGVKQESIEALRPSPMHAISRQISEMLTNITLLGDDNGLGGLGVSTEGVYNTLVAERDQLMREGRPRS